MTLNEHAGWELHETSKPVTNAYKKGKYMIGSQTVYELWVNKRTGKQRVIPRTTGRMMLE